MNTIVHICSKPPIEAADGGSKAILQIHEMLQELPFQLKTIVFYSDKHPVKKDNYKKDTLFLKTPVKSGLSAVFGSTRKKTSLITERHFSAEYAQQIELFCKHATIVIFDGLIAGSYLPIVQLDAKKIYRAHNIESDTYLTISKQLKFPKNFIYRFSANQLFNFEQQILHSSNLVWAISPQDQQYFRTFNNNAFTISYCISGGPKRIATTTNKPLTIGLLAAFDWEPNQQAFNDLIKEIKPFLNDNSIQFLVAGKESNKLTIINKNITILGPINQVSEFYKKVDVVVNPVTSGGGLKIKTLEAMQFGKVILGFHEAFRGHNLAAIPNSNIQIHNSYSTLKNALQKLILLDNLHEIGLKNQEYVLSIFNLDTTAKFLKLQLEELAN